MSFLTTHTPAPGVCPPPKIFFFMLTSKNKSCRAASQKVTGPSVVIHIRTPRVKDVSGILECNVKNKVVHLHIKFDVNH